MSTYGTMQDRIADEINRTNLTSQIQKAIISAIKHYERKRFYFNETRDITFSLSSSQEFYSASDNSAIPKLVEIDEVVVTVSNNRYYLTPRTYDYLERISTGQQYTSTPNDYAYYAQKLRVYPIPVEAYPIRISGVQRLDTLSATTDTNAWMTDAEELIRARAKKDLFANVIRNPEEAVVQANLERDAYRILREESNSRQAGAGISPTYF